MIKHITNKLQDVLMLDTVLLRTAEYSVNVIGNGKLNAEQLSGDSTTIDIIVNCGNANAESLYVDLDSKIINIVKSKHALKHLSRFKNHTNIVHIVPDSYDVPESVPRVVKFTNEELTYGDYNLLLHPAAFSLLIADNLCTFIKNTRIIGYTFDAEIRNEESLNSIEYDIASFEEQKRVLHSIQSMLIHSSNEPLSCKQIMRDKAEADDVVIIAEITTNHGGSLDRLCKMALAAKNQGADIVKIQKRDIDSIYSAEKLESSYDSEFGTTLRDYRNGLELSIQQLIQFDKFCTENSIPWFASVLDDISFNLMRDTFEHFDLVKLPSTISRNEDYILNTIEQDTGIDVVISTGMTDRRYINKLLQSIGYTDKMIYIVHAVSCYPTPLSDLNIGIVSSYTDLTSKHSNIRSGFSGHDIGSLGSILSVAAGATVIEKHVKYGDEVDMHYGSVALDLKTNEFKEFVKDVHDAKLIMGSKDKEVLAVEHHKY